jgi:hypothetical protein
MSNRALAVAIALQTEMPEMQVETAPYTRDVQNVSTFDGPVILVSDGVARGLTLSIYGDEGDDISGLAADLFRSATKSGYAIGDREMPAELLLSFSKMEPLLDESDFRIGERLHFVTIEHSSLDMAAAA